MSKKILTASPATEPVSVEEARAYLRVSAAAEDSLIGSLIVSARAWVEQVTRRALISQKWKLVVDAREIEQGKPLCLPFAPLIGVESVTFYNIDDEAVVAAPASFRVEGVGGEGRIVWRDDASFPSVRDYGAAEIVYTAGYGDAAGAVPQILRMAILQLVAFWFEHRGDALAGGEAPASVLAMIQPFRILRAG